MERKHAYLIMAHSQFEQLKVLIQQIDYPYHDIFIHVDKRAHNPIDKEFLKSIKYSKVYILEDRLAVRWGTFDQTNCELRLISKALEIGNYSYYHLMSGADLLIKPASEIYRFFEDNYGKEYVQFSEKELSQECMNRVNKYHFFIKKNPSILQKIPHKLLIMLQFGINRVRNSNIIYQKGSNWFSITDKFACYLYDHKEMIYRLFRYTLCGDEFLVQTLLINSPYKKNIVEDNFCDNFKNIMYEIDWKRGNPYVYTMKDFEMLKNSSMLYARKFNWEKDSSIILKIRDEITNVESKEKYNV